ncbi:zona pellucida sperm-binding protein 3-like isoform X1 [Cygnus olor]|uniref:zona pellucida sperm-binding protein 3-like isoform X1 n=1 Tax=Cygnus olor TaxID=8869 RepID=UPI001ADE98A6|nr:zona pellucida sperm-binding protein 3-like isoform X1 [Cygnus olor]
MKAQGWLTLLLVTTARAWARAWDSLVQVHCGSGRLSVAVPAGLLGTGAIRELWLGSGCGVTGADGGRYRLEHPLTACGTVLQLLPDTIRYSNVLHYRPLAAGPVAHPAPFSLPVECRYPRRGSASSGAVQPTWVPFGSTVTHRRRLRFALDAYDRSWSSRLPLPTFVLGELINIQASVAADTRLPLQVFVDECVASPGAASQVTYQLIGDGGCLLDGRLGRSRFLPQRRGGALRFQLDTFLFPNASSPQIFLRCHLRAAVAGAGGSKACSYDRTAAAWRSPDGADCSCCGSPAGCRARRRRDSGAGLLGAASLRLRLLSASPSSPTAPQPGTAPPHCPSAPVLRGDQRDSGTALPVPATTLVMVAMGSILAAVGALGCYCSARRYRSQRQAVAPGEPRAVAMAPTGADGTQVPPVDPAAA